MPLKGIVEIETDQVEDFNLPPDEDPTLENCEVLSIENITNLASVYPNPSNGLVSVFITIY